MDNIFANISNEKLDEYKEIKNDNVKLYIKNVKYKGQTYQNLVVRIAITNSLGQSEYKELNVNNKYNYKMIYYLLQNGYIK